MTQDETAKAGYLTPLLRVSDIERSVQFYELLGLKSIDTDRASPLGWARLHCEGGAVMFLRAEETLNTLSLPVLLYMYTPDLPALREHLLSHGIHVPPVGYPEYMPSGEINIADPDGYRIAVGHWGQKEHEAWTKRISSNE
jgi:catechol 2,3-dioxygenase-like lactoylglutathione lyase family enzyme